MPISWTVMLGQYPDLLLLIQLQRCQLLGSLHMPQSYDLPEKHNCALRGTLRLHALKDGLPIIEDLHR